MARYLLILFFFAASVQVNAQYSTPQNYNWVFGSRAGVSFSSGSPTSFSTAISTSEGCASVSDGSGNLLFYTDGQKVWDNTNALMPTASGVLVSFGTSSSTQGALIAPVLGTSDQYYVFSLEQYSGSTGYSHLAYSIIDMSARGGLGDITSTRGVALEDSMSEKQCIIPGNNCDLWYMVHHNDSPIFYAYNISTSGLSTTPVVSRVGTFSGRNAYSIGVMKGSHNRLKIFTTVYPVSSIRGTELYDFDPSTGIVSNCQVIESSRTGYGGEFSPNDTFLYIQASGSIDQYDVSSGVGSTIASTRTTIGSSYAWTDLKLAVDNQMYFVGTSSTTLGAITSPNISGSGCGYTASAFRMTSGSGNLGLPNTYFSTSGADTSYFSYDTTACISSSAPLTLTTSTVGISYYWTTGDTTRSINVTTGGTYIAYVNNGCHIDVDTFYVRIPVPDTVRTRQTISICELRAPAVLTATTTLSYLWQDGSTARTYSAFSPGTYHVFRNDGCRHTWSDTFVVSFTAADTSILRSFDTSICLDRSPIRLTAASGYSSYVWNTGVRAPTLSADTSGQYWIYQTLGCTVSIDSYRVYYIPRPPISLGSDRFLCVGDSVTLTQTHDALTTALWSTGDTGTSITTSATGLYWLQLRNGCVVSDSVRLTFSPYPLVDLGPDTLSCLGLPIRLQSTPTYTSAFYTWSNGATTDNTSVGLSGDYWLRVTIMGCSTTDSIRVTIYYDTFTLYNSDVAICKGDRVQALLTANPMATFQWLPTAGIASATSASPLITPDTSDVYKVRISLGPCPIQEDSFFIDVQPNPQVYAGGNRFVCQFDTLQLKANVQPDWYTRYSYSWSPSTDLDNSTIYNPIYKGSSTTKYIVTVTTPAGCIGRDSLVVNLSPGNFAAIGRDTALCPYDSVVLAATGGATYRWIPSLYLSDSTSANPWFHGNTTQHYMVVVTKADGCNDTVAMKVTVYPNGVFALDESYTLYPGDTVQLNATTNCGRVSWFPVAGLSNPTISNPLAMPEVTTTYIVTGITQNGCLASDTTTVNVNPESLLELPNAFRPGGGNNNKFYVIRRGDASLKSFRIFNRWGNLVFETNQIDQGWDGTWNGTPQPLGVYVYSVEAVTNTGRPVKKQGNVTLLR